MAAPHCLSSTEGKLQMENGLPILSFFWWMLIFFVWVIWIWLLVTVFIDIFRNKDMKGWKKALWVIFVLLFHLIGIIVYLIVHGSEMQDRQIEHAVAVQKRQEQYIREVSAGGDASSNADELTKLAELNKNGVLTDDEFAAQKAKLLA